MNFHLKSDRYERKNIPILKGITIVFVCLVLIQFITPTFLPSLFHRIFAPLLVSRQDDHIQTIAELQAKINSFSLIEQEHKVILSELGQKKTHDVLLGRVLSLPPQSLYDTLIIDIGSTDGVQVGKKVFAGQQIVLGEIVEVFKTTAKAQLYSSPDQKYDVIIGTGSTSVRATAIGRGGGMFEALVPRGASISMGDTVTVPEISTTVYGTVSTVIADPVRAFVSVLFQSPIPLQSLRRIYVER